MKAKSVFKSEIEEDEYGLYDACLWNNIEEAYTILSYGLGQDSTFFRGILDKMQSRDPEEKGGDLTL